MAPAFVIHNEDRSQIHSSAQGSDPRGDQALPLFAPSPPATLVPMRSTESKIRLERGDYLNKKRSIDFITYREGCPIDKHSKATVRDEDPTAEISGIEASRDDCSNSDIGDAQQKDGTLSKSTADDEEIHPLYVIQKTGTKNNHNQSTRVSKAYSFEEYWKIFDSVVEGCRCISIAGCAAGGVNTPDTSFGNSIDEADGSSLIANQGPARLVHTPVGDGNNNCYYGQVTPQNHRHATSGDLQSNHPSPTSSTANVVPSVASTSSSSTSPATFLSKGGTTYTASSQSSGSTHQQPPSLRVLRDLERELSDDDDFRPAHRTSACFVLHEKDKVNDIFR